MAAWRRHVWLRQRPGGYTSAAMGDLETRILRLERSTRTWCAVAVRLASPTSGEAGIEFGRFVPEDRVIRVRRIGFDGETTDQIALDGAGK
jgi:hypothetical protein